MQGMHYRAIDEQGQVHLGYLQSSSRSELQQWVYQHGWRPLPVTTWQWFANKLGVGPRSPRWSKMSAALFTLHLSQLLSAGVPLIDAIQELLKLESQRSVKFALLHVVDKVERGASLSVAMASAPALFSADYLAVVEAGEKSGNLIECLAQQAAHLQWQADLTERLKTVLAYPLFALLSLVLVFLFVLLYLVPTMLPLLSINGTPIPMHTKALLALSDFFQQFGWSVLFSLVFVPGIYILLSKSGSAFQKSLLVAVQTRLLKGPYGQILVSFSLARYARTLGLLYESGIEITEAMRISHALTRHALLARELQRAHEKVLGGASIAGAMQSQHSLPPLFVRMLAAGEKAGVLDVALRQCADQLQSNARYSLDRIERLIGPVLLCIMGSLLLWVALSVLGPIYSSVSQASVLV